MLRNLEINFLEKNISFYNKLSKEEREEFNKNAFLTSFRNNQFLNITERECTGLIIVVTGQLRAFLNSDEGKEVTLYRLFSRDLCIFSSSCIFNNINFNISLEAKEDTEVIILSSRYVDILSKKNIDFQKYLLELTQSKMSEVVWLVNQILFTSFDKRLKDYLLDFNCKKIKITHNTIANDLGTAREVVSRMLKHFEREGMIKMSRGEIEIIDLS